MGSRQTISREMLQGIPQNEAQRSSLENTPCQGLSDAMYKLYYVELVAYGYFNGS